MPSTQAKRLCPDLIILPVNMAKYRETSRLVQKIFYEYTALVEPLSLDEAYLDVSESPHCQGSATFIAKEILKKIFDQTCLTASAGVAPNKFLAKIASGWNKPNGLFIISPSLVENFVHTLPVEKLHGVGKITAQKLHNLGLKTCADIKKVPLLQLTHHFGKLGRQLYEQSRGIDHRPVDPNRIRKSLSVEKTFLSDIKMTEDLTSILNNLYNMLIQRLEKNTGEDRIKNIYIKIKTIDFKIFTREKNCPRPTLFEYQAVWQELANKKQCKIRLVGIGVRFSYEKNKKISLQQNLW